MRKITLLIATWLVALTGLAQGWPANYGGVMMQGFFWDSYLPMPFTGPNGTEEHSVNRQPVDPNLTWATIYGAGWGTGNDEWPVPITTWAGLINNRQYIAPYIDLLWLPQSGASISPAYFAMDHYEQRPWYGSNDPSGQTGNVWVYNNGDLINHPDCNGFVPYYWYNHGRDGLTSYFGTEAQLKQLISEYKADGCGAIEDVVVNHKGYVGDFWVNETYTARDGSSRSTSWSLADLVTGNGGTGADDGEYGGWVQELAHTSTNVQENVMNYLNFLKNDLGYVGFRFDFARGISAKHFYQYNEAVTPTFSVGEFWDYDLGILGGFIDNTDDGSGPMTAAFDFPLHNKIKEAFNDDSGHSFRVLDNAGLIAVKGKKRYAVTFIENHDTFKWLPTDNSAPNYQHRINHQVMEANAFILAMPGTPCLFYPHFMKDWNKSDGWHSQFVKLIHARRAAGVTNEAAVWAAQMIGTYGIAWHITGNKGDVYFALGTEAVNQGAPSGFTEIWRSQEGKAIYCISNDVVDDYNAMNAPGYKKPNLVNGYPVIDKRSGAYGTNSLTVNVKPSSEGCTLVYTTTGIDPTASSPRITASEGEDITLTESATLKVGVLVDNKVVKGSVVIREYVVGQPSGGSNTITIYVRATDNPNFYLWTEDEHLNKIADVNGAWPGSKGETQQKTIGGISWWYKTITKPSTGNLNLILNWNGNGEQRAAHGIQNDTFYALYENKPTEVTESYMQALNNPSVTIDQPTGEYNGKVVANLTASNSDAEIYYTIDGSDPTTSSPHATGSTSVTFNNDGANMLRAAVYHKNQMINKVARTYWISGSTATDWTPTTPATTGISVYVKGMEEPNLYAWTGSTKHNGNWPGGQMTEVRKVNNVEYYYKHFNVDEMDLILNPGGDTNKTATISLTSPGSYFFNYTGTSSSYTDISTSSGNVSITSTQLFNDQNQNLYILVRNTADANSAPYFNAWEGTPNGSNLASDGSINVGGQKWWYKKFTSRPSGINIKTDNSWDHQSGNITDFGSTGVYYYSWSSTGAKYQNSPNETSTYSQYSTGTARTNNYSAEYVKSSAAGGGNTAQFPSCATPLGDDYYYFYWENSVPYQMPYTWVWNGTTVYSGSCWPGEALVTPVGTATNGNTIYRWAYKKLEGESMPASVIFNDNGDDNTKTDDLAFVNGGYYRGGDYIGNVDGNNSKSYRLSALIANSNAVVGQKYAIENDLYVGYVDYATNSLFVRDVDGEAVNISVPDAGEDHYDEPSNYDQANWMQIVFSDGTLPTGLENKIILGNTLYGTLDSKVNPQMTTDYDPMLLQVKMQPRHMFNEYYIVNFYDEADRGGKFFVDPKPNEYVKVKSVMYDPQTQGFYVHPSHNVGIGADEDVRIPVIVGEYWDSATGETWEQIVDKMNRDQTYGLSEVYAIVKVGQTGAGAPAVGGRSVKSSSTPDYTLSLTSATSSVVTSIDKLVTKKSGVKEVVSVKYYNMMGVASSAPFDGINIVVTTYTDGSTDATKLIK